MLDGLLKEAFHYFVHQCDPVTGLVADRTQGGAPCSIGVMGMALTAYISGVERRLMDRETAVTNILKALRFLYDAPQGKEKDATGYKGFYYHFLDMRTGRRVWQSELSTIDTAFFIAGALTVAAYFSADTPGENTLRELADKLYRRVDWAWALNGSEVLSHGWKPGSGFLKYNWDRDYSEAMILYILAMGSPTHPIGAEGYKRWGGTFLLRTFYDIEYIYAGPLFIHQFSQLWIDFREIFDDTNRNAGFSYFENSRRATLIHRRYAMENPNGFKQYSEYFWGLSASDGPGNTTKTIAGVRRKFYGYMSRGAPEGPDDGTVSPWAVVASLPFAPEIVLEAIKYYVGQFDVKHPEWYGFSASFNPTYFVKKENQPGWVSPWRFGLNEGAMVIMIENYQSGLIWGLLRNNECIRRGLLAGGFSGGWLGE